MSCRFGITLLFVVPLIGGSALGDNIAPGRLRDGLDRSPISEQDRSATAVGEFRKLQEDVVQSSTVFLVGRVGENRPNGQMVEITLDALLKTFVPKKSGQIEMQSPISIVDRLVNKVFLLEKARLKEWTGQLLPTMPLIGNLLADLVESHRLQLSNGILEHKMHLDKPVSHHYTFGRYSLSGGAKIQINGSALSSTPVATLRYGGKEHGYQVSVSGRRTSFQLDLRRVNADVHWDSGNLEFALSFAL